jgi:hypothetical protein
LKRTLIATVSAAALAVSLAAHTPALAQAQLSEEVTAKVTGLGIDLTDVVLTEEDVLEIENVLNGTDDDATKTMAIEEIVAE